MKAGARLGWFATKPEVVDWFRMRDVGRAGEVPAFEIVGNRYSGALKSLPAPAQPFGLVVGFLKMTDADLRIIAHFTGLRALELSGTQLTDAGLKELAALQGTEGTGLAQGTD